MPLLLVLVLKNTEKLVWLEKPQLQGNNFYFLIRYKWLVNDDVKRVEKKDENVNNFTL
jgi:hypothetical protein